MTAGKPGDTGLLLTLLSLGNFVVGMGAFVVVGIITPIADGLQVDKASAAMVLTAYALAYAVLSPIGAGLTGAFSRRRVLTLALCLFGAGSVFSALSTSIPMLAASRILVAFGAALYTPLSAGVAVAIAQPEFRGRALAKVFGGMTMAQVIGVPAGAWLAYRFGWEVTFWVAAALAALVIPLLHRLIPADVKFHASSTASVFRALMDIRLLAAVAFTATIMTAIYTVFTYFGPLIEASVGGNAETRTLYLVLFGLGAVAGNHAGGVFTDRIGPFRTLLAICAAQAIFLSLLSVIPWPPAIFALLIVVWSCFGWSFMAPQQARLAAIAPEAPSLALALNAAMIYAGIALGSAIAGRIMAWQGLAALGIAGGTIAILAGLHLYLSDRLASRS